MRFSVATNFDPALVDALRGYPVVELFGKLREDAVGGGRAPYQLAHVSRKRLASHVREARAAGISFNYLLNASCPTPKAGRGSAFQTSNGRADKNFARSGRRTGGYG